jgi:vacuolar-type H+-ATPase subunit E/Vma4
VTTPSQQPQDALCAEILADARREGDEIVHRARQEAEALLAKAAADAAKTRQERLDAARAEAARRRELILATVAVEANRMRSSRVEKVLQSIHNEISRRLVGREGFDYRQTLITLANDALSRMSGDAFVVKLSPADRAAFDDTLTKSLSRRAQIVEDAAITGGGVVVETADGRQVWNNRLPARLERLWPELRRQIAVHAGLVPKTGGGV